MKNVTNRELINSKKVSANKCKHGIKRGCTMGRLLLQYSQ